MIGKLKGLVDSIFEKYVIIDVGGVGYLVYASGQTLQNIEKNQAISLYIETHVREDHIHLYGFTEQSEQEWFNILTTVKGVGTKMALAILSVLSPANLITAIMSKDKAAFTQVSGVGAKLGDRILTELKDKAGKNNTSDDNIAGLSSGAVKANNSVENDAICALVNLGYGRSDAFIAVCNILKNNENASIEDVIRDGLRKLSG